VSIYQQGAQWKVRHNSILHVNGVLGTAAYFMYQGAATVPPDMQFIANATYVSGTQQVSYFATAPVPYLNQIPISTDYNVLFLGGAATFAPPTLGALNFAVWQGHLKDIHGKLADPVFANTSIGFEDLHVLPISPAVNIMPAGAVTTDIDGHLRPASVLWDAGADEYALPLISVEFNGVAIPRGGTVYLGSLPQAGEMRTFVVRNIGQAPLELSGLPAVGTDGLSGYRVRVRANRGDSRGRKGGVSRC
jgi:hypothetical protein